MVVKDHLFKFGLIVIAIYGNHHKMNKTNQGYKRHHRRGAAWTTACPPWMGHFVDEPNCLHRCRCCYDAVHFFLIELYTLDHIASLIKIIDSYGLQWKIKQKVLKVSIRSKYAAVVV